AQHPARDVLLVAARHQAEVHQPGLAVDVQQADRLEVAVRVLLAFLAAEQAGDAGLHAHDVLAVGVTRAPAGRVAAPQAAIELARVDGARRQAALARPVAVAARGVRIEHAGVAGPRRVRRLGAPLALPALVRAPQPVVATRDAHHRRIRVVFGLGRADRQVADRQADVGQVRHGPSGRGRSRAHHAGRVHVEAEAGAA